jgi:hypothetical protein
MKTNSIMQVIFRGAYWLRSWAQLQRDEQAKDVVTLMSKKLEIIALEISNTPSILVLEGVFDCDTVFKTQL